MSENWKGLPPEVREIFARLDGIKKRSGILHYKLVGREIVAVEHLLEWAQWYETADRLIAVTEVGEFRVSTVFLGIDHGYGVRDAPVLFETMVFGQPVEMDFFGQKRMSRESLDYQPRYSSYDEAEAGHRAMCEEITRLLANSEAVTAKALSRAKQTRDGV
jgi:hypothetical protein